jgi:hypothetical protein
MVFDVTRKLTYKNLDTWYEELQRHAPGIPTLVVANKIDIDYQVRTATMQLHSAVLLVALAAHETVDRGMVCISCDSALQPGPAANNINIDYQAGDDRRQQLL